MLCSQVEEAMMNKFRQPGRRAHPTSGFTLVEAMVASVILVIFCVAFLSSAIASMRSQQLACDYYKAMTIARNRIQRATEFEYANIILMKEIQQPVDDQGLSLIHI